MTVIAAAVTKKDGVVIVGDSEVTSNFTKDNDGYSKLWVEKENGQFIFGGCGGVRAMQVIKHWTSWPFHRLGTDIEEFMVKEVVPAVHGSLDEHNALMIDNDTKEVSFDGAFIMAWGNNLFVVEEDFSVMSPVSQRYAIGSGQSEALGHLGNQPPYNKEDVIEAARKSLITSIGVGGPLWVLTTKTMIVEQIP